MTNFQIPMGEGRDNTLSKDLTRSFLPLVIGHWELALPRLSANGFANNPG
jgi:hypothetical protein